MPSSFHGRRPELGQNNLVDRRVAARMVGLLPPGPVLELGAGDGALTRLLAVRPWPVTAVELDPRRAARLRRELPAAVRVEQADMLEVSLRPAGPAHSAGPARPVAAAHRAATRRPDRPDPHDDRTAGHIVSNVPFGITSALLRRLLGDPGWATAVLLLQWEVARKRAGVGRTTLLTASWWPWFEFELAGRVPAAAFRPRPAVDGGLLVLRRRTDPLVDPRARGDYQRLVRTAFSADRLRPALRGIRGAARWAARERVAATTRPGELSADQWASLHAAVTVPDRP